MKSKNIQKNKHLSKILALTLAAVITISPSTLTWASDSEFPETFTDSSDPAASFDSSDPVTSFSSGTESSLSDTSDTDKVSVSETAGDISDTDTSDMNISDVKSADVKSLEWSCAPTKFFTDFEDYPYSRNLGVSIKVTYNDDSTEEVFWSQKSSRLGTLKCSSKTDKKGNTFFHYYFSRYPSLYLDAPCEETTLAKVKNLIPELKLNAPYQKIERNFNNGNTFKFTVPKTDKYYFYFTGNPVPGNEFLEDVLMITEDPNGNIIFSGDTDMAYRMSLNKGETLYITAFCAGDFTIKVKPQLTVSGIELENPEVLPPLYLEFLQPSRSYSELMDLYLEDAVFKLKLSDGSSVETRLGETLHEYGKLISGTIGNYNESSDSYDLSEGPCNFWVYRYIDDIEEPGLYSIGAFNVKSLKNAGDEISGLSDHDSGKSYYFPESEKIKPFYLENTSDKLQIFNLEFSDHSSENDYPIIAVTSDSEGWSTQELYMTYTPNGCGISVTLKPHAKMYLAYSGTATSAELTINQIQIKSVLPASNTPQQLIKDTEAFGIYDLKFNVTLDVNGEEEVIQLSPSIPGEYNLLLDISFDPEKTPLDKLPIGKYNVTTRISQLDEQKEFSSGTVEILSYKDLFSSPVPTGTTVVPDSTRTYNGQQCTGFKISEYDYYMIDVTYKDNIPDDDCSFFAASVDHYGEMSSDTNSDAYLDKGLLMVFTTGASKVSVLPASAETLKKLYKECRKLKASDYTEKSWEKFSSVLAEVRRLLIEIDTGSDSYTYETAQYIKLLKESRNNLIVKTPDVPEIKKMTRSGNKIAIQLSKSVQNAEGYDFVLIAHKKDLTEKKYLYIRKNQSSPATVFRHLKKGTYYVSCHAWRKINSKKVFSNWSSVQKIVIK